MRAESEGAGAGAGAGDAKGKDKDKDRDKKKRFQKKTRQVFLVPEATRQLRREEKFPWVMEDGAGQETWVGTMEEVAKSQTHAMFMPAADNVFKFVPAHRWYKFQKKPSHHVPNLEEAESLVRRTLRCALTLPILWWRPSADDEIAEAEGCDALDTATKDGAGCRERLFAGAQRRAESWARRQEAPDRRQRLRGSLRRR